MQIGVYLMIANCLWLPGLLGLGALVWRARPAGLACLTAVSLAVAWGCIRAARMDVRFHATGVTVRNFWRTHRLSWDEVSHFGDGGADWWALNVACRDGRSVVATGTTSGIKGIAKTGVLTTIGQVAEFYHVPVEVAGHPAGSIARNISSSSEPTVADDGGLAAEISPAVLNLANLAGRIWALIGIPIVCGIAVGAGLHLGAAYLTVVGLASAWLFSRFWRMGVRFDGHGVRIRGFLKTTRLMWAEVSHFADGRARITAAEKASDVWALAAVLNDGRAITIEATALRGNPGVLASITGVARRYQIPVHLTGRMPVIDSRAIDSPGA